MAETGISADPADPLPRHDYVIIGAGVAGCVLAGRLATGTKRVLVLEAGPGASPVTARGASFFEALAQPGRTVAGFTAQTSPGAEPRPYQLGRGLGGGSALNAMVATPGSPADYDRWERDLGCRGWGWSSLRWTLDAHELTLGQPLAAEWGTVDRALVDAALSLGHDPCPDYFSGGGLGVGPVWLTRRDGQRVSVADAYLPLAGDGLTVRADTTVDHIVLDGRDALGVVTADGVFIEAGEVIVCSGAIHSPAILLRSGVERTGIGNGLKDHPSARLTMRLHEPNDPFGLAACTLLRWSSTDGVADLQLLPLNHLGTADATGDMAALVAAVMAVHSTGVVSLTSHDPAVQPTVRLNLLEDERDRRRLREAARHMAGLVATAPFQRVAADVFIDDTGTPLAALADDDDAFDRWLVAHVGDCFHAACTCRMGPRSDDDAVVDPAGLVHGYRGLRVCDASIFADLPRANPYLPTVMVAEQIAAMVKASWS